MERQNLSEAVYRYERHYIHVFSERTLISSLIAPPRKRRQHPLNKESITETVTELTDAPSGRELVEKAFVYMTNLSRECRKGLTSKFEQEHKGMPFESVEPTIRKEVEAWFAGRDRNITVKHERSDRGRPGEVLLTYSGASKDAHFKFRVDAQFTVAGSSANSPAYLKAINVNVDKRDFTK